MSTWTYTSKAKVSHLSQIPEADLQDEWIDWVQAAIDDYEGTTYTGTTSYTEEYSGDGTGILLLAHTPVVSVTSLAIEGGTYSASDYEVYTDHIELESSNPDEISGALGLNAIFPKGEKNISITYVAGNTVVPKRVEQAATQMVATIAAVNKREGSDLSIKYSRAKQEGDNTVTETYSLQSALESIKKKYLKRKWAMR
jgi:hypothetical protein